MTLGCMWLSKYACAEQTSMPDPHGCWAHFTVTTLSAQDMLCGLMTDLC